MIEATAAAKTAVKVFAVTLLPPDALCLPDTFAERSYRIDVDRDVAGLVERRFELRRHRSVLLHPAFGTSAVTRRLDFQDLFGQTGHGARHLREIDRIPAGGGIPRNGAPL